MAPLPRPPRRSSLALLLLPVALLGCARSVDLPHVISPAEGPPPVASPEGSVEGGAQPQSGRLPTTVVPRGYELALTVDPARDRFEGEVRVAVELLEPASSILVHGFGIEVREVVVHPEGGRPIDARWEPIDVETGLAAVRLPARLPPGALTLRVRYDAPFGEGLRGLYRVERGEERYAFTQLESTWARRMFPCFDEPGFKTPFTVSVTVPEGMAAFGNAPAEAREPGPSGWTTIRFAPTPPLPTYLVALAVGPFEVVEAEPVPPSEVRARPLPLRGIAVRGRGAELTHALRHTGAILSALEGYFGTAYPYAKLDLVAVPDFGAGAMENAGLVTYREALLLVGDGAPEWQRRAFASVTAHELAHMWFGNLVTMRWWDDLWLNEAMATWMASRTVAALHPEHHAELAALSATHRAMGADSLAGARRIREPIASEHDIHAAFDPITYEKGAAVLRMVERWVGEEAFREGIRRYLEGHAWGTATADDLVAALSGAARRDVGPVLRSFLDQPGLPFVETELRCDGRHPSLALRQRRYLPLGSEGEADARWSLPLCVAHGDERETRTRCGLLEEAEGTLALSGRACPAWIVPNPEGASYLRFALGAPVRAALERSRFTALDPTAQLVLADSLEAAFRAGSLDASDLLAGLPALAASDVRQVATVPMDLLHLVLDRLVRPEQRGAVRALGRRLYRARYARLGWEALRGGDGEEELMRAEVVHFMARVAEDPRARVEARRRAERVLPAEGPPRPGAVEAALLGTVLAVGVEDLGAPYFDRLLAALHASEDALFRVRALSALGSTRDPELAERARALALDPRLRIAEVLTPLWAQLSALETRSAAWSWILSHLDALVERLGSRADRLPRLGKALCSEADAAALEAAFAPRVTSWPSGPRALAGALESVHLCAALVEAQAPSAQSYFAR